MTRHEDDVMNLWDRLGPAGGAAMPHIPTGSASDALAALVNASTGPTIDAWAKSLAHGQGEAGVWDHRAAPH